MFTAKVETWDFSFVVQNASTHGLSWRTPVSIQVGQATQCSPCVVPYFRYFGSNFWVLNSIILLNQLNQVVVIATGLNSCDYIFDSSAPSKVEAFETARMPLLYSRVLRRLEDFLESDERSERSNGAAAAAVPSSLLSGSLSLALCYIQRVFRSGALHPQPRILCLQGSPDGPEQYVAVMNAIFSAQRSMVPIDSCVIGAQHSAFLQQASYITGGVYLKPPMLDGLFQYLSTIFATDLHSRSFLQLPKPVGVDFRASCFCHKKTIDMGYICSVCLSIFCKHHKKCSTCGSVFGQANPKLPQQQQIGRERLPKCSHFRACICTTELKRYQSIGISNAGQPNFLAYDAIFLFYMRSRAALSMYNVIHFFAIIGVASATGDLLVFEEH
ncbi:hypothetical protein Syun_003120 [Stephania yunnanensis]|uniref:General transcription and DNA repair factor IIH subunit TFB4 n=1 Tax=Stephania yunnanensis TaxID=152371 RepID=A0AAP0PZX5_9MAGN